MFLLLWRKLKIFLDRSQLRNQRRGAKAASATFCQAFRKFNPKIQAFKHVLDLILSVRGAEVANQFNSFNDFWILAIYSCYSYGFKNVQNVIEVALELLFLLQNHKNRPRLEALTPRPPFVHT